ncbi:hypothetical protein WH47_06189 [Habropoda laboriosa]|uniref:Uncharacterized protein n=1 Tax=Habropoda laboriosa TaxID=597456 RepID=A0A0L7QTC0_9HYME|nr:PREDICTED: uncharacterized protein LOC108575507 [Habropoda laboriosa]KOC61860.1 hypothetical protein WH47_06189 [Habropoda laboriosa]
MKKSPLSTPSGSRGKQNYNWKVHDHKNATGYNYVNSDSYQCSSPNGGQTQLGNDFIPLNVSTPLPEQKRYSGNNWHGSGCRSHRNSGSGGFNHYRNNYHATPKSNLNNSYSPYKHHGKQFYGQKKGYQKDVRKHVDISNYVDMKSFLEDPWAELTKKLNKSKETKGSKSFKIEQSVPSQLIYIDSKSSSESKSRANDDSQFSSESRNETSVDVTLGLDDTDISDLSRTKSSIDLKLDNVRFSEESKNISICSNNDSACKDTHDENIRHSCTSKADIIQDLI